MPEFDSFRMYSCVYCGHHLRKTMLKQCRGLRLKVGKVGTFHRESQQKRAQGAIYNLHPGYLRSGQLSLSLDGTRLVLASWIKSYFCLYANIFNV